MYRQVYMYRLVLTTACDVTNGSVDNRPIEYDPTFDVTYVLISIEVWDITGGSVLPGE